MSLITIDFFVHYDLNSITNVYFGMPLNDNSEGIIYIARRSKKPTANNLYVQRNTSEIDRQI